MEDLFNKDFLKSIGYEVVADDGVYGKAKSIRANGKKILKWNRNGPDVDYFGEKIELSAYLGVRDDWDTRSTFNGIVRTREQIKMIVELTI